MSAAPPVSQGFGLLGAASRSRQSYAALRSEGAPLLLPKPLPAHRVAPHTPPPRPSPAVGFVTGPSATLTIRPTPKELEKLGVPFSRGLDTTVEVRSSREGAHLGSALKESSPLTSSHAIALTPHGSCTRSFRPTGRPSHSRPSLLTSSGTASTGSNPSWAWANRHRGAGLVEIRTIRNGTCQRRRVAEICQEEKKRLAGSAVATEASVRRQLPSSRNGAEIDASFWSRDHAGYWEGAGRGAPPLDDGSVVLLIRLAPQL